MTTDMSGLRALVVGESWIKHTVHMKGFDHFQSTEYEEGAGVFLQCLERSGISVTYIRGHEISGRFPTSREELDNHDVVIISDVGANSFLLTDETFLHSQVSVNRLELLADYVELGGGLVMVGGYLSFSGIDGRARYGRSPLARVLPVEMFDRDDRVELPEGFQAQADHPDHPVLGGTPPHWPTLLGYNQLIAKEDATVVVRHGSDPVLVTGTYGLGKTVAFASDLAPHWAPPQFLDWEHYQRLWESILTWAAAGRAAREGTSLLNSDVSTS